MSKIITYIFIVIALFLIAARGTHAQELTESSSGTLKRKILDNSFDYRVENLRFFLGKFNSPLADYAGEFVSYADTYGLDYRLVPAITGVESTFGKRIPYKSYNAYGWSNGEYRFSSWEDSIGHVSMSLRTKYIDKGAGTVAKIGRRYAPPSVTWAGKVKSFMGKIDYLPLTYDI